MPILKCNEHSKIFVDLEKDGVTDAINCECHYTNENDMKLYE